MDSLSGYQEIDHTADWALNVWAPDFEQLLSVAAEGMYVLSDTRLQDAPRVSRSLTVHGIDAEGLLVNFLTELLYLGEDETLGFDRFALRLENNVLHVRVEGARIARQEKEIKAVTYHNLYVRESERGLEVTIVFDV